MPSRPAGSRRRPWRPCTSTGAEAIDEGPARGSGDVARYWGRSAIKRQSTLTAPENRLPCPHSHSSPSARPASTPKRRPCNRSRMPGPRSATRGPTPTTTRCAPPSRRRCGAPRRSSEPWPVPRRSGSAGPDEVADLLGMPVAEVRDRNAALRGRSAAHDEARAAEGLEPADWALDVDLDAAVEHLLAGHGDPPDPGALVEERRRSVRRRVVVAGGAAALAAGATGWWVLGRERADHGPPPGAGAASPSAPPRPGRPELAPASRGGRRVAGWRRTPGCKGLVISCSTGGGRPPGRRRGRAAPGRLRGDEPGHRGRPRAGVAGSGRRRPGIPDRRCRC